MRSHSYLNSAKAIIEMYDGSMPLAVWLKNYFKANKKFGSTDRKQVSHICYCYYRMGNAFQALDKEEKMLLALFLCSDANNIVLEELNPGWNKNVGFSLEQKIKLLSAKTEINSLFPFAEFVSKEIDLASFQKSLLIQPDLFIRIRPGKTEKIIQALEANGIHYALVKEDCIQLNNGTKIEKLIEIEKDAVVQDLNSQQVLNSFQLQTINCKLPTFAWDCCAASGGKSILFHDHFPRTHITVSDVRESILTNLHNRFKRAGIKNYRSFVADISANNYSLNKKFDIVICDAPCSGSGTWSRTPEQLSFFKGEKISYYADLQKKIALNASKSIKPNGFFLYITCSVFKMENEEVVEFIQNNTSLQLQTTEYLKGYDKKADTLFASLFRL